MAESSLPPPLPIDRGDGGIGPALDRDRRAAARRRGRDRLRAAVVRSVVRERRLGRLLDRELGPVAIVLHGRMVPGAAGTIDHLVVAGTGVWVIEARHETGRVVRRRCVERGVEAWLSRADGSVVELVAPSRDQVGGVFAVLDRIGFGWMDVHRAVCLTNADWGVFHRPFEAGGALVTWGRALVDAIAVPGPVSPADMRTVAAELSSRLPRAGGFSPR